MSGEFQRFMDRNKRAFLNEDSTEDESIYQAWRQVDGYGHHEKKATSLLIVPAIDADPKEWQMSYLQTLNLSRNRATGQICLMFPSSGLMAFLEGRGLEPLPKLLSEHHVKSIHMFDETIHQPVGADVPIITKITMDQG